LCSGSAFFAGKKVFISQIFIKGFILLDVTQQATATAAATFDSNSVAQKCSGNGNWKFKANSSQSGACAGVDEFT